MRQGSGHGHTPQLSCKHVAGAIKAWARASGRVGGLQAVGDSLGVPPPSPPLPPSLVLTTQVAVGGGCETPVWTLSASQPHLQQPLLRSCNQAKTCCIRGNEAVGRRGIWVQGQKPGAAGQSSRREQEAPPQGSQASGPPGIADQAQQRCLQQLHNQQGSRHLQQGHLRGGLSVRHHQAPLGAPPPIQQHSRQERPRSPRAGPALSPQNSRGHEGAQRTQGPCLRAAPKPGTARLGDDKGPGGLGPAAGPWGTPGTPPRAEGRGALVGREGPVQGLPAGRAPWDGGYLRPAGGRSAGSAHSRAAPPPVRRRHRKGSGGRKAQTRPRRTRAPRASSPAPWWPGRGR